MTNTLYSCIADKDCPRRERMTRARAASKLLDSLQSQRRFGSAEAAVLISSGALLTVREAWNGSETSDYVFHLMRIYDGYRRPALSPEVCMRGAFSNLVEKQERRNDTSAAELIYRPLVSQEAYRNCTMRYLHLNTMSRPLKKSWNLPAGLSDTSTKKIEVSCSGNDFSDHRQCLVCLLR